MNTKSVELLFRFTLILVIFLIGFSTMALAAKKMASKPAAQSVIKVTAKQFEFSPNPIILKKGKLTEIHLTTLDVRHGFNCPDLNLRADILPGKVTVLKVKAMKTGTFPFSCDVFCGVGHGDMVGMIKVTD